MSGIPAGAGQLLGKRLGKYEILALLALGGTAEIYLARIGGAAGFEKYVVVKCLHDHLADDQEFVKMFLDEARLAAHLDHSNIVQTMELGEHEDRYYMVMEFLAGLSLAMIVRRAGERLAGGRLPAPMSLNILAQACAGLHYAHEKAQNGKPLNIVHRDISPQNLVVSFEGVVKVVDFGIAKAELRETKTRSGTIKGKFAYMSPEQCIATNVDRRTDVFALGVIAHELLTGRRLFKKPSPYETYQAVIDCNVELPSKLNVELDPAIDPLIMKALAKDKDHRYPTAEAFGDALLGYLHHRGKASGPGEVSRFFDTQFSQEIDEHSARMRELISGREPPAADTGLGTWTPEEERRRNETVDLGAASKDSALSLDSIDLIEAERQSVSGLNGLIDELGTGREEDDEDDMPAERTRIENNPLEQIAVLDQVVEKQKTPAPVLIRNMPAAEVRKTPAPVRNTTPAPERTKPSPSQLATQIQEVDLPAPARPKMPPSGPLPLPPQPLGPPSAKPPGSGKFPDLANLPTMVADGDVEEADEDSAPELAPTSLGAILIEEGHDLAKSPVDPHARTNLEMQAPNLNGIRISEPVSHARPSSVPPLPQQATQIAPQPQQSYPAQQPYQGQQPYPAQQPYPSQPQYGQPQQNYGQPQGAPHQPSYPVMNAELREQIATGASVFPSPPGGRPSMPELDPNSAPLRGAARPGEAGPFDPSRAAELASPVGQHYGDNVDWAAVAAAPAKAIPPWKLILMFVGALGLALLITILITRAAR